MSTSPPTVRTVNPIRQVRTKLGKTLQAFADESHMHIQALYLNERGVYHEILPTIHDRIARELPECDTQYRQYQQYIRQLSGMKWNISKISLNDLPEPDYYQHPVVRFRRMLTDPLHRSGLSRMAFCKSFCVHPAELYSIENGFKHSFSEQLVTALTEAGLDSTVLAELQYRTEEFAQEDGC